MLNVLTVGAGGFVGAALRYLAGLVPIETKSGFPVKTFAINIVGCFVIGVISALITKKVGSDTLMLFLKAGVCGGFTTFSSFALETQGLFADGNALTGILYALGSLAIGTLAVLLGQVIVK